MNRVLTIARRLYGEDTCRLIFEPLVARDVARHRLLDEILSLFGGRAQPMMAQLAEAGKLTLDDVRELEKTIKTIERQQKTEGKSK